MEAFPIKIGLIGSGARLNVVRRRSCFWKNNFKPPHMSKKNYAVATLHTRSAYRPTHVFAVRKDPKSHKTSIRIVAQEYQKEIPPIFTDPYGNNVNVYGIWQQGGEHYPCPRDYTNNNVLVMTNRGIFLYCYGCSNFFTEGGRWGYKTSYAAFQQFGKERRSRQKRN